MLFGTFDILHLGHIALFRQAKKYGDTLIVVIARDPIVAKVKGQKPIHSEQERMKLVKEIRLVDKVVLGDKTDTYTAFRRYRPDVVALGYDQEAFVHGLLAIIREKQMRTKIVRLEAYRPELYKSKKLKKYFGV